MNRMRKKFINILNVVEVMNRLEKGLTVEGALFIDSDTHQLSFKPYHKAKYQPGYYKRPKPKLIKKLPWGWLKQSVRNNILHLSVPIDLGTAHTMNIFKQSANEANNALIDMELKEFC